MKGGKDNYGKEGRIEGWMGGKEGRRGEGGKNGRRGRGRQGMVKGGRRDG